MRELYIVTQRAASNIQSSRSSQDTMQHPRCKTCNPSPSMNSDILLYAFIRYILYVLTPSPIDLSALYTPLRFITRIVQSYYKMTHVPHTMAQVGKGVQIDEALLAVVLRHSLDVAGYMASSTLSVPTEAQRVICRAK